jgi:TolA-binding protein
MRKLILLMLIFPLAVAGQGRGQELYDTGRWGAARLELTRERASAGELQRQKIDFELAQCAANLGETDDVLRQVQAFEYRYPNSIYLPEMRLLAGFCYFEREEWARALEGFADVGRLPRARRNEYFFKRGYAEFMLGRDGATASFGQVGEGEWYIHAQYYLAYSDYVAGRFAAAKLAFKALADEPSYAPVAPYYLLQIEFHEGNYDYVIEHGEGLLERAVGERRTEIARAMAESYFHLDDWDNTLKYSELYRSEGGAMGRGEWYIVGYSEYSNGYPGRAVAALARAVGPDDRLTQNAAYHMAAAALELGDKRAAMQSFSIAAAADYDPQIQEDAIFNNGKLQYELGGGVFNEAINVLQRYVERYPDSPRVSEATEYLAAAYYNTRNYDAAYDAIKRVAHPDNSLRTALQKITYLRALELYNQGLMRESHAMLEESARNGLDPKYAALTRFWMGEILYRLGDWTRAAEQFRHYLALAPAAAREYKMALYGLGYASFNRHEWAAAREWFDKFVAAYKPADDYRADALNRLGDAYFASREFWRAIEMYDKALVIPVSERYYAEFRRAVTLGYVDRAARKIESLNAIINTDKSPYASDALYESGLEYIAQERFADARKAMLRYVERYPKGEFYPAALVGLGLVCQNLNDSDDAIKYYKQAVAAAPSSPQAKEALLALQSIYVGRNNVDEYFDFAAKSGVETDLGAVQRDSLAYAAAAGGGARALETYLERYPHGAYRADALWRAAATSENAIKYYNELVSMSYNSFTIRALERLAPLLENAGRTEEAVAAWQKLADTAVAPETVERARTALENLRRQSALAEAEELEKRGDPAATAAYRALATESRTAVGARATLKTIESLYAAGDLDGAQTLVMRFAEQGAAHQHDLARAFIILGDIYVRRGDTFQARATWQSIVDGYSPADDGIIDAARKKIEGL